jgi:hypothetical protein
MLNTSTSDPDELEENEELVTADVAGQRCFVEGEVLPWFETLRKELANRPLLIVISSSRVRLLQPAQMKSK